MIYSDPATFWSMTFWDWAQAIFCGLALGFAAVSYPAGLMFSCWRANKKDERAREKVQNVIQ